MHRYDAPKWYDDPKWIEKLKEQDYNESETQRNTIELFEVKFDFKFSDYQKLFHAWSCWGIDDSTQEQWMSDIKKCFSKNTW